MLGVNYQEGPVLNKAFVEKSGVAYQIVRDTDGAVAKQWGVKIFLSSFVVDRAWQVRHVLIGEADWTGQKLVSTVSSLL